MADKLKPGSKAAHIRNARWRHNGYFGHTKMAHMQMLAIIQSSTTTAETKAIAIKINGLLYELGRSLKERVDVK